MSEKWSQSGLIARGVALGDEGGARQVGFDASLGAGLSLLIDEEGTTAGPLLRVLAGEVTPPAGTVRWGEVDVCAWRERSPGGVFWRDPRAPCPDISPEQWVGETAACYPTWRADDWQRHVQGLALQEHLHKEMFRLSTGSKRKVLLAAALASGAPLTLIDEPEAALDHASIRYLREALGEQARRAGEAGRVWVVANYELITDLPWNQVIRLP